MMDILPFFISHQYGNGGAAIAAQRLDESFSKQKITSSWYVKKASAVSSNILSPKKKLSSQIYNRLFQKEFTCTSKPAETAELVISKAWKNASLYHFHNLHGDFVDLSILAKHVGDKPVFLTLHDMWTFTGHCSYSYQCSRYQTACGDCPDLSIYPAIPHDNTAAEIHLKQKLFREMNCHFIAPSQWIADCFQNSILNDLDISIIPYPLDTNIYTRTKQKEARRTLGADEDTFTILLSSVSLADPRKSQHIAIDAINQLADEVEQPIQVLTMGDGALPATFSKKIKYVSCGYLNTDEEKVSCYNAADLFLFTSQGDNLPLSIQESLACGTPVLANKVGGIPEMVIDKQTGWLVESNNSNQYYHALKTIVAEKQHLPLSASTRSFAEKQYRADAICQQHLALYQTALRK